MERRRSSPRMNQALLKEFNKATNRLFKGQKKKYAAVSGALDDMIHNPGNGLSAFNLANTINEAGVSKSRRIRKAFERVQRAMSGEEKMDIKAIRNYVDKHFDKLFLLNQPVSKFPKSDEYKSKDVLALRRKILVNKLFDLNCSSDDIDMKVKGLSIRGVSYDGQWKGNMLCQESAQGLAQELGGQVKEVFGKDAYDPITFSNHYYILDGDNFIDPTWKQFFPEGNTFDQKPIFKGTGKDFEKLGLDDYRTYRYLKVLGRTHELSERLRKFGEEEDRKLSMK